MIDNYVNESLVLLRNIDKNIALLVEKMSAGKGEPSFSLDSVFEAQSIKTQGVQGESGKSSPPSSAPVATQSVEVPPPTNFQPVASGPIAIANEEKSYADSFAELKELMESETWPLAVDQDLICNDESDDDRELRAEGIIEFLIDEDLEGKKFLDFGCGDGFVTKKSLEKKPALSMGYDLHANDSWSRLKFDTNEKHRVTDKWEQIVENGPYDIILLYDVLDHLEGDHVAELKKIRSVMKPGGRLYIRCHPWCSRHATHLYKKVNRAFLHLVFSEVELARLGLGSGLKTQKIIHPHMVYKQWFNDAGLDMINENPIQENLEDFFHMHPIVNERIKDNWKGTSIDPQLAAGKGFPGYQMRICFVDYLLKSS